MKKKIVSKKGRKMSVEVKPNEKYGRLTVIKETKRENGKRMVRVECECGKKKNVALLSLVNGATKSCGCLRKETAGVVHGENSLSKIGDPNKRTTEYNAWRNMYKRCTYKNDKFHNETYLKKKIGIVPEWREKKYGFVNFLNDMGRKPGEGYSLERVDNDEWYGPKNCVWATSKEQARNTSRTAKFIKGIKYGKLTLLKELELDKKGRWVEARCRCGSVDTYEFRKLYNGIVRSCGCDKKTKKK